MPELVAVNLTTHAATRWQPSRHFHFAGADALCPIVLMELNRVVLHLPIAFVRADTGFSLVAVQGVEPGRNLLVGSAGEWRCPYIPAAYRAYPFALARTEQGQEVLCFDAQSGLVGDALEGERLFNEDGTPSKAVGEVMQFLSQVSANRKATEAFCGVLQDLDLLEKWPISIQHETGAQTVEGLFRINEHVFNTLSNDAFLQLRASGALPAIYCQLISMQNVSRLLALPPVSPTTSSAARTPAEISFDMPSDFGNLNFDDL